VSLNLIVRRTLIYRFITLIVFLLPGLSSAEPNPVAERKAYWEKTVRTEIPLGTPEAALFAWARRRSLSVLVGSSASARLIGLETVPVRDLECKEFGISLDITIGPDDTITSETVKSLGICL
jgi:hypothetical protein